jgi:hypothetical protein
MSTVTIVAQELMVPETCGCVILNKESAPWFTVAELEDDAGRLVRSVAVMLIRLRSLLRRIRFSVLRYSMVYTSSFYVAWAKSSNRG